MSQLSYTSANRPSALRAALATIFAMTVVVYLSVAIGTSDHLWFLQRSAGEPERIIVHFGGQNVTIEQNEPHFADLNNAINVTLSGIEGFPQNIGLSEQTLVDYRQTDWSIEASYAKPLQLHSRFRFGEPSRFILPLTGRHSDHNILFLGNESQFYTGPSLKTTVELKRTLREYGLAPSE